MTKIVASGSEIVLVQSVGGDQLLAAELVGLSSSRVAKVGDDASVRITGYRLLYGSAPTLDDGAVVAQVVLPYF